MKNGLRKWRSLRKIPEQGVIQKKTIAARNEMKVKRPSVIEESSQELKTRGREERADGRALEWVYIRKPNSLIKPHKQMKSVFIKIYSAQFLLRPHLALEFIRPPATLP